ncbi:MAG: hypothetical protein GX879_02095 [Bacteroidales bacterium]|nr:hypothetical protein [Bacteroidales bacterium]
MQGRTSIKKVLPAIWNNNAYLHEIEWFKDWLIKDENGEIINPYEKLSTDKSNNLWGLENKINLDKDDDETPNNYSVKDGGAAMKAYKEMIFTKDANRKEILKKQLLEYCKLDTLAMVIIFMHWKNIAENV